MFPSASVRRLFFPALVAWCAIWIGASPSFAAISTTGDVSPTPPTGGGSVTGPLHIGNTGLGTLSIADGTALTNSGQATVGETETGIGIVTMDGLGSDWTLTTSTADLIVGDEGIGTIDVTNLAKMTVADDTFVGQEVDSTGHITVRGLGTLWENGDDMTIGGSGLGIVDVSDGGRLNSESVVLGNAAAGEGRWTVEGEFSRWELIGTLTVGSAGRGSLRILDGGRFSNTLAATLGTQTSATGFVEVNGTSSHWTNVGVTIGSSGIGTVKVLEGGRVTSSGSVILGTNATGRGEVVVDGFGSVWNITGNITTLAGEGQITISNGGLITTTTSPVIGALGTVTLAGGRFRNTAAGGIENRGVFKGTGTIDAALFTNSVSGANRGSIRTAAGDQLVLTGAFTNSGFVDLSGGELRVNGSSTNNHDIDARNGAVVRFGGTGLDNNSGAQLAITSGVVDVFGDVDNNSGAQIVVGGEAVAVFHDSVTGSGQVFVQPGGEILVLEDLGFGAGASLNLQLAAVNLEEEGTDPSDGFGQVQVSGAATLAGTLSVGLLGGFMPQLGDSYQILTAAGGVSGVFGTEDLPSLAGDLGWDVNYNASSVVLSVISGAALPGDYNQNGAVDAADYTVWRDNFGSGTSLPNDDTAGVGQDDYERWVTHFGESSGLAADGFASAAVPEPTSLALAVWGLTLIVGRWRATENA